MSTGHLARARDYLARGEEFYARAADEIIAAQKDDPTLSGREVARRLERSETWVRTLVQWRTSAQDPAQHPRPFSGPVENEARYDRQARTALKDPERRRKALAELDTREVEQIARDANEVAMDRVRAERREHATGPTVGELMGDTPFRPGDQWMDGPIMRVAEVARNLVRRFHSEGLVLGSLPIERALEYLEQAERDVAEVRAAVQERVREEVLS